ncbi:hypothetical protein MYU51_017639 [Penicillium brevicompactum]
MPRKPTPAAKQRVRTGCLTCRKRRRKCDEQKPRCANCEVKGFTCKYGSDLAFVPPRSGVVPGAGQGYSTITFVDDSPAVTTDKKEQKQDGPRSNAELSLDGLQSSTESHEDSLEPPRAFEFQSILSSAVPSVDFSEPPIPFIDDRRTPNPPYMNTLSYFGNPISVLSDQTAERRVQLANSNRETDLLRHFRSRRLYYPIKATTYALSIINATRRHVYPPYASSTRATNTLIHGDPDVSSPQAIQSPELAAFPSLRQSHSLSQWTFLWSDCQKWYNDRPVNVKQIVDIRGGEADHIDPDHDSSFPILIYTTPMALVANAVYHMISLLLLTHKPRLLKSLPGPRSVTSHIWHAQSIAGIAASNDSPEQWDPVLVASLLVIAKEMTHESQQTVILQRLAKITATTGIKLDREREALQAAWNLARYEEEFEDEHETI